MHNAAANGALSLFEVISGNINKFAESEACEVLKAFAYGAREDATTFLSFADSYDATSVLTCYNRAKIDILSEDPVRIALGIDRLLNIEPPAIDTHPADLSWHKNNYECFVGSDRRVREIIKIHYGHQFEGVNMTLERNARKAKDIESGRGEVWKAERPNAKALIVAGSVGTTIAASIFFTPDVRELLVNLLSLVVDVFAASMGDVHSIVAAFGDGGLPLKEAVAVTFGDGGLPFA